MHYVGIDIAKANHCCAVVGAEGSVTHKPWTFANDIAGFQKLGDFLRGIKDDLRIALEATGHYGSNLKLFLEREGFSFMECQPSLVAEYIKTQTMRKTKTDNTDAIYIAGYSRSLKPEDWRPVPRGFYRTDCLKRLTRFRLSLVHQRSDTLVQITNVLDKTFPEFKPFFGNRFSVTALYILANYGTAEKIANMNVKSYDILRRKSRGHFKPSDFAKLKQFARETVGESNEYLQIELNHLLDIFSQLDCRIDSIESEIAEIIDELDPPCLSVKGIGIITAAVIVAEIGDFLRFSNVDKCLAFAGLEPQKHDSGQSHRDGKMHKHGSKYLREALMNVVVPLSRSNVVFAEYYRKKRAEGKTDLVARSHTAKKLLRVIYALHTRNIPYDPDKLI